MRNKDKKRYSFKKNATIDCHLKELTLELRLNFSMFQFFIMMAAK